MGRRQARVKVISPDVPRISTIPHVPHASTFIPDDVRQHFVVDDETVRQEVIRLTDWHVDELFSWLADLGGTLYVNELSRLVFDPERLTDDAQELAAKFGQGVVYTHTSDGRLLVEISAEERARRIRDLCQPYHEGLTRLVRDRLEQFGECLILDCHSCLTKPMLTETGDSGTRPDMCIGSDDFHTPAPVREKPREGFETQGFSVEVNSPFEGSLVPTKFWGNDQRVHSVMIEVRRDLYCDEATGERLEGEFERVRERLEA